LVEGLVDAIVEVTETGEAPSANKLRIIQELMKTNTQLIAIGRHGMIWKSRR